MAGVTGAFLILPFQMSFLGFTSPSVSSTNYLYNLVGAPGGVIRYIREKRMSWPLVWCIVLGTLPGVLAGYYLRVRYLPDPGAFKFFVGLVLFYVGARLVMDLRRRGRAHPKGPEGFVIKNVSITPARVTYEFMGGAVSFSVPAMFLLSLIVGVIGGIYGIGGGAIIAPICVAVFRLPVYTVAGAALMGTFVTSIAGIIFYAAIPLNGVTAPPDWPLGILFGVGGLLGMYLGARMQRHMPERIIKIILAVLIFSVSAKYIVQFFAA